MGDTPEPASSYSGKPEEAVWLPNERVARAWAEYVKTGAVSDTTPPSPPFNVKVTKNAKNSQAENKYVYGRNQSNWQLQ